MQSPWVSRLPAFSTAVFMMKKAEYVVSAE
jgi:hypothetical protein